MKKLLITLLIASSLPASAFAAQFVSQPLFLSKTPAVEGVKVRVYAIVSNNAAAAFNGTVQLSDNGALLGSPAASMAVGATQTVSVSWAPTAGVHKITAQLTATDGTAVQSVSQIFTVLSAAASATTTAAAAAQIANQIQAAVTNPSYQSSEGIQDSLRAVSPAAATTTLPAFAFMDGARQAVSKAISSGISTARAALSALATTTEHAIAASTDSSQSTTTISTSASTFLWSCWFWTLVVLRFLIDNAYVFYPLFAFLVIFILWRIYKGMVRRPKMDFDD